MTHCISLYILSLIWEFPKIGDPNIVPYIVGPLLDGPQNKVPPYFRKLPYVTCTELLSPLESEVKFWSKTPPASQQKQCDPLTGGVRFLFRPRSPRRFSQRTVTCIFGFFGFGLEVWGCGFGLQPGAVDSRPCGFGFAAKVSVSGLTAMFYYDS